MRGAGTDVLFRGDKPPSHADQRDYPGNAHGVVHVCRRDGSYRGEEEHNADKEHPDDSDGVDRSAPASHGVWPFDERDCIFVHAMGDYNSNVAEVEGWSCDVENGDYGLR